MSLTTNVAVNRKYDYNEGTIPTLKIKIEHNI